MKTALEGYVGIDTLTEQIRKKALRQGFEFNVMVVGGAGLGKSTLVNTIFKSKVSRRSCQPEEAYKTPKTVEIKSISHVIEEKGIRLRLTITDTPGFGDHVDNSNCWHAVVRHINEQYEKYLNEEISIKRKKRITDTRVHCCIYFIAPTGHSLKQVDIEALKKLVEVANVVPVIAKSDSLTLEEREAFKARIRQDLIDNDIRVYPDVVNADHDEEEIKRNIEFQNRIPFAIVGSTTRHQVGGKTLLARQTPWGFVEVENEAHCEFLQLRDMIIRTHLQDLKEVTAQVHYELYRHKRLEALKELPLDSVSSAPASPNGVPNNHVKNQSLTGKSSPASTPKRVTPNKVPNSQPKQSSVAESNI